MALYDDDDLDAPQESDLVDDDSEDESEAVECDVCGGMMFPGVVRCPHCGEWLTGGRSAAAQRARGWFWPVMVAILVAVILVIWSGLRL